MKRLAKFTIVGFTFMLFLNSSCNIFSAPETESVNLIGMYKLVETISSDGLVISSDGETAPFVYREWYGFTKTQPQQPIDSLFLLKNIDGELMKKYAIKEQISFDKRTQRKEYLLSTGKYFYIECDHDLIFYVSEFVDSASDLKKDLKKGKYEYLNEKPENW